MLQTSIQFLLAVATVFFLLCGNSVAQQLISFNATEAGTPERNATLTLPKTPAPAGQKSAAVVLLHSKGGWEWPVTAQYAGALREAGFVVLELRLFNNARAAPPVLTQLPALHDALRYLAAREDVDGTRIGVAGFSYGGTLALHAAAAWAQATQAQATQAKTPQLKFAAHAPFYPVCWAFAATAQGKRRPPGLPADAFANWTGAPVRIFAGGRDDYDGRDPNACAEFVASLPAGQREAFSITLYPEATHGWDQAGATFFEPIACKGRGCTNTNEANPQITRQSIAELVGYFSKTLAPR